MKLMDLKIGEVGVVINLSAKGAILRRLLELGFIEGAKVQIVAKAPFGRTILVNLMGDYIALSSEICNLVLVKKEGL